jgi:UDP-N-acetylmuramoyl-L-alanyl-D-glutamate--2,6-diaminopimelate ligase
MMPIDRLFSIDVQSVAARLKSVLGSNAQLRQDSRTIQAGDVFVAFSGDVHDGRSHIAAAIHAGAGAILAEQEGLEDFISSALALLDKPNQPAMPIPLIAVKHLKQALGGIAAAFYGDPSQHMATIAVTGTNGKTTVVNYLAQLLQALCHQPCAVLGTLGAGLYGEASSTGLTTPQACAVHKVLADALSQGAVHAAIEATSIGLQEGRLNGVLFDVAALTNLTQDHLDYHGTMDAYAAAKRRLFDWQELRSAVINIDDAFGAALLQDLTQTHPHLNLITTGLVHTMGRAAGRTLCASDLTVLPNGTQSFILHHATPQTLQTYAAVLPALGEFNVHNILTVLGCVLALGHDLAQAVRLLPTLQGVTGRMQVVTPLLVTTKEKVSHPLVLVDYAHTPDGLQQALLALRPVVLARGGTLSVVLGCGGNRDATKRPLMGAIAQQYADSVIITNDNPRDESPSDIAQQIASAAPKALVVLDRATAIRQAIRQATALDVVLIAGKGHETTQLVAGVFTPFSDVEQATLALNTNINISII